MSWWSRVSSAWSSRCGAKGSATSLELWDAASILAQHRGLRIFFQSLSLISCLFISLLRTQDLPSSISWFMIYPLDSVLLKNVSFYTLVQHSPISLSLLTLKKLSLFSPPSCLFISALIPYLSTLMGLIMTINYLCLVWQTSCLWLKKHSHQNDLTLLLTPLIGKIQGFYCIVISFI